VQIRPTAGNQSGESSGQLDNLAGLWSGNDSVEVRIFANFTGLFPALGHALDAALFLVQLFLPTDTFSLTFFHAVFSRRFEIYSVLSYSNNETHRNDLLRRSVESQTKPIQY
jgi:hypothetical protein